MINPQIGEQYTVQESGSKLEIAALLIMGFTAAFFCWFLYQEHVDGKSMREQMLEIQQKAYERMVLIDLENRFGDA